MARTGKTHPREAACSPYLRHPAAYRLFSSPSAPAPRGPRRSPSWTTFTDGDLDVPGGPRVIPTPGHSPGHVAFHLPDRGVLIAGDALCTYNALTGARGPQPLPRAFALDSDRRSRRSRARAHRRRRDPLRPWRTLDGWPCRGGGNAPENSGVT